ncbi:hypothetical protein [Paenibacillus sp. GP183]|uniref:hypothetical protein n=1 Tax=Paenibacillus sp. GP183 TaxID=1882751 RepID=UPI0008985D2F|nr:hypothetical protein [Paenibacillus sp. GP183]SEB67657.1 hypothetical protein SAMN05443246_1541 [Paenibacillus sp. GP183]
MDFLYIFHLIIKNIDSINISLLTGVFTGWVIVLLDTTLKEVQLNREGFEQDKYRKYQLQTAKSRAISRFLDISMITDNEDIKLLIFNDFKTEMEHLIDFNEPFRFFHEKFGYRANDLDKALIYGSSIDMKLKNIIEAQSFNEINMFELRNMNRDLLHIAVTILKSKRNIVKCEAIKYLFGKKKSAYI